MKEKITLFIALSFLIGLTVYKKSTDTTLILTDNISSEVKEANIDKSISKNDNSMSLIQINKSNCDSNELNIDKLQFSEAFKYHRNCNHNTFIWNGLEYTTILKNNVNDNLEKNHESLNPKLDLVIK